MSRAKITPVERTCQTCGRTFPAKAAEARRRPVLFCSRECYRNCPVEKKFLPKVGPPTEGGCHPWVGCLSESGYGKIGFYRGGKIQWVLAHRIAWEIAHGPIPEGMEVCHNCPGGDNPRCVNVAHLFLGTHADNMADKAAKGRQPKGEQCHLTKFSEETVQSVLSDSRAGVPRKEIAGKYGMTYWNVCKIVTGKSRRVTR